MIAYSKYLKCSMQYALLAVYCAKVTGKKRNSHWFTVNQTTRLVSSCLLLDALSVCNGNIFICSYDSNAMYSKSQEPGKELEELTLDL